VSFIRHWRDWEQLAATERPALPARYGTADGMELVDVPGRFLKRECRWVYGQMEPPLRASFAPFFVYVELRTIFSAVRFAGDPDAVGRVLADSLLGKGLTDELRTAASSPEALEAVTERFSPLLGETGYPVPSAGTMAVERWLVEAFLARAAGTVTHAVVRSFFSRLVDMRNILSTYKRIRWAPDEERGHVPGGSVSGRRLVAASDETALDGLVRGLTGRTEGGLEPRLLSWTLAYEKVVRSHHRPEGPVLSYLLRLLREARNLSLLMAAGQAGREHALAELTR
jgi:hypothetical protein